MPQYDAFNCNGMDSLVGTVEIHVMAMYIYFYSKRIVVVAVRYVIHYVCLECNVLLMLLPSRILSA